MRSRIGREYDAGLIGALRGAKCALDRFDDLGLERRDNLLDLSLIVGSDQLVYRLDIVARHRPQQIPADPFPDRSQRAAQYPAGIGMLGSAVDEQRFQWREKMPRGISSASLGRPILGEFRAQYGQDLCGAGHFAAADFQPLELGQKVAARQRRQSLQVIANPIALYHAAQYPQFYPVSTIGPPVPALSRAHANMDPRKADRRKLRGKCNSRETTGISVHAGSISTLRRTTDAASDRDIHSDTQWFCANPTVRRRSSSRCGVENLSSLTE